MQTFLSTIKKILFVWVFAIFPISIIFISLHQIEKIEISNKILTSKDKIQKQLKKLSLLADEVTIFHKLLEYNLRKFLSDQQYALRYYKKIQKNFPNVADIFWFNKDGQLIHEISSNTYPKRAVELVYKSLLSLDKNQFISEHMQGLIKSFLKLNNLEDISLKSTYSPIYLLNRDFNTYLHWQYIETESKYKDISSNIPCGFIALIHQVKINRKKNIKLAINLYNKLLQPQRFCFVSTHETKLRFYPSKFETFPSINSLFLNTIARYENHFEIGNDYVFFIQHRPNEYLLAFNVRPIIFSNFLYSNLVILSIAWIAYVFFKVFCQNKLITGKISYKLFSLFLFAVLVPSLILLIVGFYALKDHENVIKSDLQNKIKNKIYDFDTRLLNELAKVESFIKKIINKAKKTKSIHVRAQLFEKLRKYSFIEQFFIIDSKNSVNIQFDQNLKLEIYKRRAQLSSILCRELLRRINNTVTVDATTLIAETTESIFSSLLGHEQLNLNKLIKQIGKFSILSLFGESSYVYVDAFVDNLGSAESILLIHIPKYNFEHHYISNKLQELIKQPDIPLSVVVYNIRYSRLEPENTLNDLFSKDLGYLKLLNEMANEVLKLKSTVTRTTKNKLENCLWVGTGCQNLSSFLIIAKANLGFLHFYLANLWFYLKMLLAFIIISTIIISFLLVENILVPIKSIEFGINAVKQRKFDHKIPIYSDDELADVSNLFNKVIEGMHDLQIAKVVQESLFPDKPLVVGNYSIYGYSRSMADIGGDYFEYFATEKGLIFGLIGDVSGHGVSAALVMGMAKCAINYSINDLSSPSYVISQFNKFLVKNIKRKKMMTMFVFLVDTNTNTFTYVNAGHNYPLVYQVDKNQLLALEVPSLPLGVREKINYTENQLSVNTGDTFLFYTDGFVESPLKNGEVIGYELLKKWFLEVVHFLPDTSVKLLFQKFDSETFADDPHDDITLIVLKRLK